MSGDDDNRLVAPGVENLILLEEIGTIGLDFYHDLSVGGEGTNSHLKDDAQNNVVIEFDILLNKVGHVLTDFN